MASPMSRPDELVGLVAAHRGMAALHAFNELLHERRMAQTETVRFLASFEALNRLIPAGILTLAARLAATVDSEAHSAAAVRILAAGSEELGLPDGKSHRRLFLDFAAFLGVQFTAFSDAHAAVPEATTLGRTVSEWYRNADLPFALGMHLASELTSAVEFSAWARSFSIPGRYGLWRGHPAFAYLEVHERREVDHCRDASAATADFLKALPTAWDSLAQGASRFMDAYDRMLTALHREMVVPGASRK